MADEQVSFKVGMSTQVAVRTLRAAGFTITNSRGQPEAVREVECERADVFGQSIRYTIVLCDAAEPPPSVEHVLRAAARAGRVPVTVARAAGADRIAWTDFVDSLGGPVPTWRALASGYAEMLEELSRMRVPAGMTGEAWRLFEEAVADGLEFVLGRRVQRLGGLQRGQRVPDLLAQRPDGRLLVVDTKATEGRFNADWPALRPLAEYVSLQRTRQRGQGDVGAAVVVAPGFKQTTAGLADTAGDFVAQAEVPVVFLPVATLQHLVALLTERPTLRSGMQWARILGRPGLVTSAQVDREIAAAERTRVPREPRRRGPPPTAPE